MSDTPSAPPARPTTGPLLPGRLLADRYRLERHLASGGMAEVWSAVDTVLDREVAVKVLLPGLAGDEAFRARFEREARASARLSHPSIVAVYDVVHDGDVAAIVLELVRGETLRRRLDDGGPLPPREVVRIGAAVADALDVAHRAGIVHRDVKPANILLTPDGGVKVTDFGIAKATSELELTVAGTVLGTAKYVAPEQVLGRDVDARTDVYSLAAVLYEAACGRAPFVADTALTTAGLRLHEDPAPPLELRPGLPPGLSATLLAGLARRPEDRPPTAAAFARALRDPDSTAVVRPAPAPPPPAPAPPPGPPGHVPTGPAPVATGSRRGPLVAMALVVVAVGVVLVLLGRTAAGRWIGDRLDGSSGDVPGAPLTPARVDELDPPPGDGAEHPERVRNLVDGDEATTWATETYRSRDLGGRKAGVGIVLVLDRAAELERLDVRSPTGGWSFEVFVADGPSDDLGSWGDPVAERSGVDGDASVDLEGRRGAAVLLWITDLGDGEPDARVEIAELVLLGR
ncbi:MAG: serine/threonine protein kinase [Acidimicrobiales bacterium]|nr:serine/threonine protein kinase [Acidimicrobiales bacterium]